MLAPKIQPRLEILRWRGGEVEFFSGNGMVERELPCVEHEARGGEGVFFAIDRIT